MVKLSKPRRAIRVGDRVRYEQPNNKKLFLEGIVEAEYGSDRLIVKTPAGHAWALKLSNLTLCEDG